MIKSYQENKTQLKSPGLNNCTKYKKIKLSERTKFWLLHIFLQLPTEYASFKGKLNILLVISSPHLVLCKPKGDHERLGCTDHGLHGGEDVLINQFGEALFIFIRIASPVNYSHLLNKSAFAAFSST